MYEVVRILMEIHTDVICDPHARHIFLSTSRLYVNHTINGGPLYIRKLLESKKCIVKRM